MSEFLTVKEAVKLIGKSESTIKRLLHEIVKSPDHADRTSIQPSAEDLKRKREAGEPYAWRIERQFLLRRFPIDPDSKKQPGESPSPNNASSPVIEVLREQLHAKDRQLEVLENQLDRKDEQIAQYNERLRESNVLMKDLQQRLAIVAPAATSGDAYAVDGNDNSTEEGSGDNQSVLASTSKRDSIWTRPFRVFRTKQ